MYGRSLSPGTMFSEESSADLRRLSALRHPSAGSLTQQKLDWSMASVGRWRKRTAGGKVPDPLQGFAAAHHAGSIYIFGGIAAGGPGSYNKEVHALDLSTMRWRSVQPKGGRAAIPPPSEHFSTAVWRTSICFVSSGPKIHLFDMATETWSKREAPWPK